MVILLVCSVVIVTLCSECSFLYPINTWCDPNYYLVVARKMAEGQVLYRDIFEQKGPIIYFLHFIAYQFFGNNFIGIYFLELILCFAVVLLLTRILGMYLDLDAEVLIGTICAMAVIYTGKTFVTGDSAEEICFPFMLYGLYLILKFDKGVRLLNIQYFFIGCACGFIFWTKYTLLGCYIGIAAYFLITQIRRKKYKELIRCIVLVMAGIAVVSTAVLLYFIIHRAVGDLVFVYFTSNTKFYTTKVSFAEWVKEAAERIALLYFYTCPLSAGLSGIGIVYLSRKHEFRALVLILFTTAVPLIVGKNIWTYYFYPLQMFMPFGFIPILRSKGKVMALSLAIICSIMVGFQAYENKSQDLSWLYAFKPWIQQAENPTLYLYQCFDTEFYTAYNIIPEEKYFATWNNRFPEMLQAQENAARNGNHDFIISENEIRINGYQRIAQSYEKSTNHTFYLYERLIR